jgi:asparagine synthase (glutamine-hydrolysing)
MCGIAGVLYRDTQRPAALGVLKAMGDAIAHRGPDAEGYLDEPGLGLVHRRLSIIDLTGGDQPIANEDGSIHVIFNGEIYNYRELREQLIARGHVFRTLSDTEVLVHLYEEHGQQLVEHLRGMFAFALWDKRRRRLLLARDRIGLKPLYIYRDADKLLFGSEIKALLAHGGVDRAIDPAALEEYLCFGVAPGRRTIFQRIEKLRPGHSLTVSADNLDAKATCYWRYSPRIDHARSADEWQEALCEKIRETVRAHQIADVRVGAFLSGGIDSSVMVAEMAGLEEQPLKTFAIGFQEAEFNELPYARAVAEQYGCEHVEALVSPRAVEDLDRLIHHYDEPFADPSAIPTMHLARVARREVKVAVSGDGGDEAFGGYARYAHDLHEAALRRMLPGFLRRGILGPLGRYWPKADWLPRVLRAKTLLTNLSLSDAKAYANTLSQARLPLRRRLLADDIVMAINGRRPEQVVTNGFAHGVADDPLTGMIAADIEMLLPDDFLTKVDRASMAVGLEVRPPLVDHELLELAGAIPSDLKVRGGETKWIFKQAYADRLPPKVAQRGKQGFDIPLDDWLRGPLAEMFCDTVLAPGGQAENYLNRNAIEGLWKSHRSRVGRHGQVLWSLLVFSRWADKHLTTDVPADATLAKPLKLDQPA